MIKQCTAQDKDMLMPYLRQEAAYNTFMLADIEDFGFDEKFQTDYYPEERGLHALKDPSMLEEPENIGICTAGREDAEDIFHFLQGIRELRHLYTSEQMIRGRIEKGKTPCLLCIRGDTHNLYARIGFQRIGGWLSLTRTGAGS